MNLFARELPAASVTAATPLERYRQVSRGSEKVFSRVTVLDFKTGLGC